MSLSVAEAYYKAMGAKDLKGMEKCLHPDACFKGPFAELKGKEAVLEGAKGFSHVFKSLTMRAKVGSNNQVMMAYDLDCPAPIGTVRTAVLLTFTDKLISHIEVFVDGRQFERK